MLRRYFVFCALAVLIMGTTNANAGEGVTVGVKAGTLGVGGEVVIPVMDYLNIRAWGVG